MHKNNHHYKRFPYMESITNIHSHVNDYFNKIDQIEHLLRKNNNKNKVFKFIFKPGSSK